MAFEEKLNIVLDLDETLIYACEKTESSLLPNCPILTTFENWFVYKRPHVDHFLDVAFEHYNVYIWTAASSEYAQHVLHHLLKPEIHKPLKTFTRDQTIKIALHDNLMHFYTITVKPLLKLRCNLARTIFIDDCKSSFLWNEKNGFLISSFDNPEQQKDDSALLQIVDVLKHLEDVKDIRTCWPFVL